MRAWWALLVLSSCATPQVRRETLRAQLPADALDQAFPACGLASVVPRPDHDYAVSACYQRAMFRCEPGAPQCTLRSVDAAPMLAHEPAPPAAPEGSPSQAQLADADRLFEDGRKLAKDQRLADACQRFARSDAIKRTFGTAVNLGDCADRDGQPGVAYALYAEATALAGNPGQAKFARDRSAALAPKLCTLVLTFDDPELDRLSVRVGDRELEPAAEVRAAIAPGRLEVVVASPGVHVRRWRITASAGGVIELHVPALVP